VSDEGNGKIDYELANALSHPVRLEILVALQGRVASPAELSRELGTSLGVVSYHTSTLLRCGCLELVHSQARRGVIENYFALTPRALMAGEG
jgi:DNA-binding transcriptional ArsR family regulator